MNKIIEKIKESYDEYWSPTEGIIPVCKDNKWGFVDETNGQEIIQLKFDDVSGNQFYKGFCAVKIGKNWGVIDINGKESIPFTSTDIYTLSNGLFGIKIGKNWNVVNQKGEEISSEMYENLYSPSSEIDENLKIIAIVKKNKKYGAIDCNGKEIVPFVYSNIEHFIQGKAVVKKSKFGFINAEGEEFIPCKYEWATYFNDGLACVMTDKKNGNGYGYINEKNEVVIPFIYKDASTFRNDFAYGRLKDDDSLYGYFNKKGEAITKFCYSSATDFTTDGIAIVTDQAGKVGVIDTTGKNIIPHIYDSVGYFSAGFSVVKREGKFGCINLKGKEILPCKYDHMNGMCNENGLIGYRMEGEDWIKVNLNDLS